jgi:Eukaryotic protein of unknown function (DUF866)
MVLFFLLMKADLENVATIHLKKDMNVCCSVRNPLSDYERREKIVIDPTTYIEQAESAREPPCHFQLYWEGNKKKSCTMTILTNESEIKSAMKKEGKKGVKASSNKKSSSSDGPVRDYTADDTGTYVPILCIECRGLEPTHYYPMGNDYIVTSTGGTVFDPQPNQNDIEIDFTDGDWADYDTEHDVPISISNIEFKWDTAI